MNINNYYEIVIVVHPDKAKRVISEIENYKDTVIKAGGVIDRYEEWGKRQLTYPIGNVFFAEYFLLNISSSYEELKKLQNSLRFNDGVLRYLILRMKNTQTQQSHMIINSDDKRLQELKGDV